MTTEEMTRIESLGKKFIDEVYQMAIELTVAINDEETGKVVRAFSDSINGADDSIKTKLQLKSIKGLSESLTEVFND